MAHQGDGSSSEWFWMSAQITDDSSGTERKLEDGEVSERVSHTRGGVGEGDA